MHPAYEVPDHRWMFQAREYINPQQESNAEAIQLETGTNTYQKMCADKGLDWQLVMRQRFEAEAYKRKLEQEFGFELNENKDINNDKETDYGEEEEN